MSVQVLIAHMAAGPPFLSPTGLSDPASLASPRWRTGSSGGFSPTQTNLEEAPSRPRCGARLVVSGIERCIVAGDELLPAGFVPKWIEAEVDDLPKEIPGDCLILAWNDRQPIAFALTRQAVPGEALAAWARHQSPLPPGVVSLDRASEIEPENINNPPAIPKPEARPTVSVVIATCRGGTSLIDLVESLAEQSSWFDQLIVVPNGCDPDPVRAEVADAIGRTAGDGPSLDWLVIPSDVGLSRARNQGLRHATGDLCAVIDDDIAVDRQWGRAIAAAAQRHSDAWLITNLVLAMPPSTPAAAWFEIAGGFGKGFDPLDFDGRCIPPAEALLRVGQIGTGAAMVLRTAEIRRLGGYCELLGAGTPGIGGEDLNLILDVLAAGGRVVYEPTLVVRHPAPSSWETIDRQTFRYGIAFASLVSHRVISRRLPVGDLIRLAAQALRVIVRRSGYGKRSATVFPARLRILELAGLSLGPAAYLRSVIRGGRNLSSPGQRRFFHRCRNHRAFRRDQSQLNQPKATTRS